MSDTALRYGFTCPACAGNFSILLERIPPVQARFRCPQCKQPMDFPSRDEARIYATLRTEENRPPDVSPPPSGPPPTPPPAPPAEPESWDSVASKEFHVEKPGFEGDVFDRRGIRNLIRTGAVEENDRVRLDGGSAERAGDLPFLKSLFKLRGSSTAMPPPCCRTHTEKIAFFKCNETARPLCEECAAEKKYGNSIIRVCAHCGGPAQDLVPA